MEQKHSGVWGILEVGGLGEICRGPLGVAEDLEEHWMLGKGIHHKLPDVH